MSSEVHNAAHHYHRLGLPITLCHGKRPIGKEWQNRRWTVKAIDEEFRSRPGLNVGTRLGPAAKIVDFDEDGPDATQVLLDLFDGNPPVTPAFASPRGTHRLFAWDPALEKLGRSIVHIGGLELRIGANGKGFQSLLPPSKTDGFTRNWLVPIDECPFARLPDSAIQRILAASQELTECTERDRDNRDMSSVLSVLSVHDPIERAIAETLPTEAGHRHRRLFDFARRLKAIPALSDADLPSLKPFVRKWHALAMPHIRTKDFEETWLDFAEGWKKVRFPAGQEPIRAIYEESLAAPLPQAAEEYEAESIRRLVGFCRELQQVAGDSPFFLACRTAGELLGIGHVTANKWLRVLVIDGVLQIVKSGTPTRATRYRYVGDDQTEHR